MLTGRLLGDDIARLGDAGFQKFWRTSDDRETPAWAEHLSEWHSFQEDLRQALALMSLYNAPLIPCFGMNATQRLISRSSLCGSGSISSPLGRLLVRCCAA